ncbi:MAG: hypothetical protein J5545_00975 [Bacteroidaceae bacterium]|nr:hypothetical protein [Bacteroidaceae bacterium]
MTTALKEIIRLWLRQKRHDFKWQQVFMAVYFSGLYLFLVLSLFFAVREELAAHPLPITLALAVPLVAISVQVGDLLMKLFWRRSPVEMDDYLRTRPVPVRDWARFVLFDTSMGFLQWMLPLMLSVVIALVMPFWVALLALVLTFSVTLTNALFQNCWRRAPGNEWTLPLVFGYLFWTALMWVVVIGGVVLVSIQAGGMDLLMESFEEGSVSADYMREVPLYAVANSLLLLLLNVLVCYLLQRYFMRLKNHNEEAHTPVSTPVHSLGQVSLWSIEWVSVMRSKRLRNSELIIIVIFLLNTYLQQQPTVQSDMHGVNLMLVFGIAFPSIILAQWVLGIEANFFAGIWTKPWPVEGILRRKFVVFCALCGIMAVLILPCVIWMGMSPWSWLCTLLFSCGVFVLPFMASCLFSSRMDLFASAFFNYQGSNKQLNVFSFIMFIPMGIYLGSYFLLPTLWAHVIVGGLGILGLALHRPYIHWIANIWHRRRYTIMERWQTE